MDEKLILELSLKRTLTQKDKVAVRAMIEESGLDFTFKTRCPNCYSDALAVLRNRYGVMVGEKKHPNGVRVIINR